MAPIKKSTVSSPSKRGVSRNTGFANSITATAVGVLLLASTVVAQQSGVTGITHHQRNYPVGPPYSITPSAETFKFRDLRNELRNKMTGTYTVTSVGDLYFRVPEFQRMSPQIRDLLHNADTTVGNLEGGMMAYPADRAKDVADMGFDLLAPGEDA